MTGFNHGSENSQGARKISDFEQQEFQGVTYDANGERGKSIDDLLHANCWLQNGRWKAIGITLAVVIAILLFGGVFILLAVIGMFAGLIKKLFR